MDLNIHNVVKIEVKPVNDIEGSIRDFSVIDIIIHSKEFNYQLNDFITNKIEVSCFRENRDVAKLVYSKE